MSVLYVLTGCTASGKTAAALDWAAQHGAEIISADALLFYRGMDVGTAKPTPAERARVPHHLIDIREVHERMDVKTYAMLAREAVSAVWARGRDVLVVGGSGFYLRSFFAPVADEVEVDPLLRQELERDLQDRGLSAMVARLVSLNPADLGSLDVANPRRVLRALERCLLSGRSLRDLAETFRGQPPPFPAAEKRLVEIVREPEDLRRRVRMRTEHMLAAGLVEEVELLRARGLEQNPSAGRAIGYRETLAWLDGDRTNRESLCDAIVRNTWQLVRKQRTWFRTQLPSHHLVPLRADEEADGERLFPA